MRKKKHAKKTTKLELSNMLEIWENMLVETKNDLASRVLLRKEFTRIQNSPFKTVEHHQKSTTIGG